MVDPEYFIIENFLTPEACDMLIEHVPTGHTASVLDLNTPIEDKSKRDTQLTFLEPDSMVGLVYMYAAKKINEELNWNFNITSVESIQILKYDVGGFYVPHIDVLPTSPTQRQRKISFSVALNSPDEYEGGEFIVYPMANPDGVPLKLPKGDAVVFPSFLYHEASVIKEGTRYSSTAWIQGENWR